MRHRWKSVSKGSRKHFYIRAKADIDSSSFPYLPFPHFGSGLVTGARAAALGSSRKAERTEGTRASPALSHQAKVGAHSSASCYMKNKQILTCVLGRYIILSPMRFKLKNLHFVPSRWLQLRCSLRAPQEKCPLLHRLYLQLSLESDSSHHFSLSRFWRCWPWKINPA